MENSPNVARRRFVLPGLSLVVFLAFGRLAGDPLLAHEAPAPAVHVATFLAEPWVERTGNTYSGFHADLWDAIARESHLEYDFVEVNNWADMFKMVQSGDVTIAVQHHAVRSDREETLDFTHEVFADGMQVVVAKGDGSPISLVRALLSPSTLKVLGIALLSLVAVSHLVWFFERRHPNPEFAKDYGSGVRGAFSWAVLAVVAQKGLVCRNSLGKLFALAWLFFILVGFSAFTAQLASTFTLEQIHGPIRGIEDLDGKTVGTYDFGKQRDYLSDRGIDSVFGNAPELIEKLRAGEVDALLLDVGHARYFAKGRSGLALAGPPVGSGSIGFPLAEGSPYRETINRALLRLRENGVYQGIFARYFGEGG